LPFDGIIALETKKNVQLFIDHVSGAKLWIWIRAFAIRAILGQVHEILGICQSELEMTDSLRSVEDDVKRDRIT